mmetsp:Transcript_14441/g.33592  ORF Transcript_14441/g.33592 Transcript_14441/m.33592 type:complete len:357 (-) Transcript_14441:96-1166(-)
MINSVSSIAARRLHKNTITAARLGGVVRKRLFMGVGQSSFEVNSNLCYTNDDRLRSFSSSKEDGKSSHESPFAVVDHSKAYESSMQGRHGQQLSLARLEGIGKDDVPFDPFQEEYQRMLDDDSIIEQTNATIDDDDDDKDDSSSSDDYDSDDYDSDDYDSDSDDEYDAGTYNRDGSIRRKKSTLVTLKAGYPAGGVFAVLELAGSQHKVTTDDLLVVNKLKPVESFKIGSVHTLNDVLLVGSSHLTLVGMPYVNGAEVDVMVEEITQDQKVIIFKKRRRKHSQRKNGYRRDLTLLRVLNIRFPHDYEKHDHLGRESVDDLDAQISNTSRYDVDDFNSDTADFVPEEKGQNVRFSEQ